MGKKGKNGRPVIDARIVRGLATMQALANVAMEEMEGTQAGWLPGWVAVGPLRLSPELSRAYIAANEWLDAWLDYYGRRE